MSQPVHGDDDGTAGGVRRVTTGDPRTRGHRAIMLRRPPVVHMVSGPFVPESPRVAEVDERWALFCERVPAAFDGPVLQVLGVHRNGHGGATVHLAESSYRYYAVQDADFDLGMRPLGAKGITWRGGQVLMGKRAAWVAGYPGCWEFAPGGTVEPGESAATTVVRELFEETGWRPRGEPVPIAMLLDEQLHCWEMVFRLAAGQQEADGSDEYDELRWCPPDQLPGPRSTIAERMVGTCLGAGAPRA
ncbi:MAG: NUDIX hydrolase [Phycisphaerales bacterium]